MTNDSITSRFPDKSVPFPNRNRFQNVERTQTSFFDQLLDVSAFRTDFELDANRTNQTPFFGAEPISSANDSNSNVQDASESEKDRIEDDRAEEDSSDSVSYAVVLPNSNLPPNEIESKDPLEASQTENETGEQAEVIAATSASDVSLGDRDSRNTINPDAQDSANEKGEDASAKDQVIDKTDAGQEGQRAVNDTQNRQLPKDKIDKGPVGSSDQIEPSLKGESLNDASAKAAADRKRADSNPLDLSLEGKDTAGNLQVDPSAETENTTQIASATEQIKTKQEGAPVAEQTENDSEAQRQPARSRRAERLANRSDRNGKGSAGQDEDSRSTGSADGSQSAKANEWANGGVNIADRAAAINGNTVSTDSASSAPDSIPMNPLGAAPSSFNPLSSLPVSPAVASNNLADPAADRAAKGASQSNAAAASKIAGGEPQPAAGTTYAGGSTATSLQSNGTRGEVAGGTRGGSISPYQETKLVQRVLRGLEQLADGGGQVRLRLHPPELGTLQLTLRMAGGQMHAYMEVENALAKDALISNVQTLRDKLAEQGMEIKTFDVQVSADTGGSGGSNPGGQGGFGSDSRWNNAQSRFAQQNNNRLSLELQPADKQPQQNWTRNHGSLDLTV